MSTRPAISLDWGAGTLPLALSGATVFDLHGPSGVRGETACRLVREAVARPVDVPPLSTHVVPGDRVTIAVAGEVAEEDEVVAAVIDAVSKGGVAAADITVLRSADFAAADDSRTGYLAADADARPIHLAREIIDADCVVAIGEWNWDASLGGRGIEGEIFPSFCRQAVREGLVRRLLGRRFAALVAWRDSLGEITRQLGLLASLRVIPGMGATIAAAVIGPPDSSRRAAREAARGWQPTVPTPVETSIASLRRPRTEAPGFEHLLRGVAAAARITTPEGTICVASPIETPPGPVFTRWRQGVELGPLVREAIAGGEPAIIADAFLARRFDLALGGRRLVLLSSLDQETVEDLGFGHAESAETIERLARRARRVAVLHEADRMLPSIGS